MTMPFNKTFTKPSHQCMYTIAEVQDMTAAYPQGIQTTPNSHGRVNSSLRDKNKLNQEACTMLHSMSIQDSDATIDDTSSENDLSN
jgi:LAS superfamily LD-carboxypeptidase LdcB